MNFFGKLKRSRVVLMLADFIAVFFSALIAIWLVKPATVFSTPWQFVWALVNYVLILALFTAFRLYSLSLSSVGIFDAVHLLAATAILGVLNGIFALAVGYRIGVSFGVSVVYIIFFACLAGLVRVSKRSYTAFRNIARNSHNEGKRIMLIGGGEAAATLIREMLYTDKIIYHPVCVLDDNPNLIGNTILGVKIVGNTEEIMKWAEMYRVDEIFITMPSAGNKVQREIIKRVNVTGIPSKVLPGIYQLADGQVSVSKLRHVEIQDLLGRDQVDVNLDEIMGYIENKTVLVTGGGGSIGSELCRQIASHNPKLLIILDIYENNAYEIEQELKRSRPTLNLLTLIASVRDKKKIRCVFESYRPEIVFNAAAHKHVPLMETSPNEAVKNNVFGTLNVALAADEFGAKTFVQISTDKAVNPTNIMGATKRICEMIVQTIGKHSKSTNFVAVRFGNVLGSNGSVIPLFKKQIKEGGPITVTHKDIIRYFMTIPEAVSLVLQAGAYAKGGQIFVLDMGEPVRIYDLARNLIILSGLKPDVDIEIKCTGLRPGEKLYEERLMEEEGLQKTANGLISVARPIPLDEDGLWASLNSLYDAAYAETENMKELVRELVPTYIIDKGKTEGAETEASEEAEEESNKAALKK